MATNVNIAFLDTIVAFDTMHFVVTQAVLGYNKTIQKQFVTGTPTNGNQVKIGPTNTDTFDNLFSNLILNDTDSGVGFTNLSFSANPIGDIQLVFVMQETYTLNVITNTANRFEVLLSLVDDLAPIVYVPYDIQDLEIVIIDTYTNFLPLQVQITQDSSPTLKFDSGDDLTGVIMASQLNFNMAVLNGADAYFKHLFTSDENRFLVKLNAYDATNSKKLLWQGFLLPDQYTEPYKGGVIFVEFTAIDMLASLKGKYFPRWYYENRLPIIEVFAACLKATGLNQNILVDPSFYPTQNQNFNALNIDLKIYNNNEKLTDYYKILEEVLTANCMTIMSYNGFWMVTGFGQKKEQITTFKQYDVNGAILPDFVFTKIIRDTIYNNDTVNFSLKTPYKKVEVNSNADGNKNMFSETVVNNATTNYLSGFNPYLNYPAGTIAFPYAYPSDHYQTNDFKDWNNNNSLPYFFYRKYKENIFFEYEFFNPISFWNNYNVTENTATTNYYQCAEKPYLKANVLYTIDLEIEILCLSAPSYFEENVNKNLYDKLAAFQLFVANNEVLSNRPSFPIASRLKYEVSTRSYGFQNIANDAKYATFKLKYEFELDAPGVADFRLLAPIYTGSDIKIYRVCFKKLNIGVTDDYDFTENVQATRSINYAQNLKYDTQLLSTSDTSIQNNIGIGRPLYANYFYDISRFFFSSFFQDLQVFPPASVLQIGLQTWQIDLQTRKILFAENFKNAMFLQDVNGYQEYFNSVYYLFKNNISRMGYLLNFTGRIKKPKSYKKYPAIPAFTLLKYMRVLYAAENLAYRDTWSLKNTTIIESFNKTVARLLHSIYSKPAYVLEGRVLQNVFPDELLNFYFDGQNRKFIPTTLTIQLFEGKTQIVATEDVYELVTDITYD
jgi:hypothetical protein